MFPSASSAGFATGCRFSATGTAMRMSAALLALPLVAMVSAPETAASGTRAITNSSELTTIGPSTSPNRTRGRASSGGFRPWPMTRTSPPGNAAGGTTASMCGFPFTFFLPSRSEIPICEWPLNHVEVQEQLHHQETVQPGADVVHHHPGTLRQALQPAHRERLQHVEGT